MRNKLLQLLGDNRAVSGRRFEVCAMQTQDAVELLLYDAIVDSEAEAEWFGGVAPQAVRRALDGITASDIHVRIHSPGGSVFGGRAIEQALRDHPARITVHVDGVAASAASVVAMAGDEIIMGPGAMMMIHNAWTISVGNADDHDKVAALLRKVDRTLAQTYAERAAMPQDKVAELMAAETWFTAEEAVDAGLADRVADPAAKARAAAQWNLMAYSRAPAAYRGRSSDDGNANEPGRLEQEQRAAAAHAAAHAQRVCQLNRARLNEAELRTPT